MLGVHAHGQTVTGDKPGGATETNISQLGRLPRQHRVTLDGRDSLAFTYSGGRKDDPGTSNPVNYDTMFVWVSDPATSRWQEAARVFQTFDSASRPVSRTQQLAGNGRWGNAWKEELAYNSTGKVGQRTSYYWDTEAASWQVADQSNYNAEGQQVITISKIVDCTGVLWTPDKDTLNYDDRVKADCRGSKDNAANRRLPGNTAPDSTQQGSVSRPAQSATGAQPIVIE